MSDSHSTCDCPLCPLLEANVQLCDARIKELKKNQYVFAGLGDYAPLRINLVGLIVLQQRKRKLKVGEYCTGERKPTFSECGFTFCIDKLSRNEYKVCFHAIPKIADTPTVVGEL